MTPNTSLRGYVLVHAELGVYLGQDDRFHYWSRVNAGQLTAAPVFYELDDLIGFLGGWATVSGHATAVPVMIDLIVEGMPFATRAECVRAGAGGWLSPSTLCAGPIQ